MSKLLRPLVVFGASKFPELSEIVRDINEKDLLYHVQGILDDNVSLHGGTVEGVPVLGPLDRAKDFDDALFVLGIGSYRTRLVRYEIVRRLGIAPEKYVTLVHPSAKVYSSSSVGHGCIIFPGAVIHNDSVAEDFVEILTNTVIGRNNVICEGAMIASLVTTTSGVIVGHYSHTGTGSAIGEHVKVGPIAQIAMGSVVLRDVPPGAFCFGNPPKFLNKIEVPTELLNKWGRLLPA